MVTGSLPKQPKSPVGANLSKLAIQGPGLEVPRRAGREPLGPGLVVVEDILVNVFRRVNKRTLVELDLVGCIRLD